MATRKATEKNAATGTEVGNGHGVTAGAVKATPRPAARTRANPQKSDAPAGKAAARDKAEAAKTAGKDEHAKKDGAEKRKKTKLIRDSFALPEAEYHLIGELKKRCVANGLAVKKSEVLRAAIANLAALSDAAVGKALAKVVPIKTGRPPKNAK